MAARPLWKFTFSLGLHAPAWLILALWTPFLGLVSAAVHSRRSSRRPDQSEFTSPVEKGELHQISASKKRSQNASRFNVNRTVDGATPTRRAISLRPTSAVLKRSTSRTWRIVVLSAGIRSPMQKAKGADPNRPAETPLNRATSSRNAGRNHLGTPSEIKSEWWATSSRIRGRLPPESAGRGARWLRQTMDRDVEGGDRDHPKPAFMKKEGADWPLPERSVSALWLSLLVADSETRHRRT
jgi:hypothetical protein